VLGIIVQIALAGLVGLSIYGLIKSGAGPMVGQSFLIALDMLRLHKLRAFLTMLGVIIGVMSVTLIVMVSNGFQHFISSEFQRLGSDTILIVYDRWSSRVKTSIEGLKLEDVDYLMEQVPELEMAAPIVQVPSQPVTFGERELKNPRIFATNEYFDDLNRIGIASGRQLEAFDLRNRANVCLIGQELKSTLFPNEDPIGKFINLKGITLEVVGTVERIDMMGETNARDVLLPLTTAQDKWLGGDTVTIITTRPKPGYSVSKTVDNVWEALMRKSGNKRIYRVDSRESILQVLTGILGGAGLALALVAALSLLVGGIGIMNIMLVSVTERTREIGLRKAVGAKRTAVLIQFLVEAAVLSMVGGLIGMGLAYMFGLLITAITKQARIPSEAGLVMPFPIVAALGALAFSAMIGIVFGLFPAMSAARLNPIDALRKE
jgi:putative ABC transport system permease protein